MREVKKGHFELKNGKVWYADGYGGMHMVYKLKTDNPYIRYAGWTLYLDAEGMKEARALLA